MKEKIKKIFDDKGVSKKGYLLRILIAAIIALVIASGVELIKNRRVLTMPPEQKGVHEIEFRMEGDVLIADFPWQYVKAIDYTYEADGSVEMWVKVRTSEPGAPESYAEYSDNNHRFIRESNEKVGFYTDHIELQLLYGENCKVTHFSIYNVPELNWRRMVSVFLAVFAFLIIVLCNGFLAERLEFAFVILAFCLGGILLATTPFSKSVWDEGIHFGTSYTMTLEKEVGASGVMRLMMDDDAMSRLHPPKSTVEYRIMKDAINAGSSYKLGKVGVATLPRAKFHYSMIGYIPQAVGLSIGRWMHLPFTTIHLMGKLMNFLIYVLIVYFAIKRCTVGKRILTAVALMPTVLFVAVSYNRDALFNALGFFAIAYMLSMMGETEKIKTKDFVLSMVAFVLMSAIKAVYAPLILLLLLLPRKRFENAKVLTTMRIAVVLGGVLLLASFLLPALFGSVAGDARGGNTNGTEQIRLILASPLSYARILWKSIKTYQTEYLLGKSIFGNLGVYGAMADTHITAIILLTLGITDHGEYHLHLKDKIAILVASILVICLVWTSMYVSFTEVGATAIAGVQGRYFTLLVMPLLLLFNTDKVSCTISKRAYNTVLSLVMLALVYSQFYEMILFYYVV